MTIGKKLTTSFDIVNHHIYCQPLMSNKLKIFVPTCHLSAWLIYELRRAGIHAE